MSNQGSVMRHVRMFEGVVDKDENVGPVSESSSSQVHPFNRPVRRRQMEMKEKVFPSQKSGSKSPKKAKLVRPKELDDRSERNEVAAERSRSIRTPMKEDVVATRHRDVTPSERDKAPATESTSYDTKKIEERSKSLATENTSYESKQIQERSRLPAINTATIPKDKRIQDIMASRQRKVSHGNSLVDVNKGEPQSKRVMEKRSPKKLTVPTMQKQDKGPTQGSSEKAKSSPTKSAAANVNSRATNFHRIALEMRSPKALTNSGAPSPKPSPRVAPSPRPLPRNLNIERQISETKPPDPPSNDMKSSMSSNEVKTLTTDSERKDRSSAMPAKFSKERGRLSPSTLTDVLKSRKQWKHGPQPQNGPSPQNGPPPPSGSSNAGSAVSSQTQSRDPRSKFIKRASERINRVNSISDKGSQDNDHDQILSKASLRNSSPTNETLRKFHMEKMSNRANQHFGGQNAELKRNLDAASVVMQEEKASTVSSSSSSRSSLSTEELGHIAERAIKLAKVRAETRTSRLENSPLHQILKEKRERKLTIQSSKATNAPQTLRTKPHFQPRDYTNVHSSRTAPPVLLESQNRVATSESARVDTRISNRINRAEKFASMHRTYNALMPDVENNNAGHGTLHPIFRYAAPKKPVVKSEPQQDDDEDTSTVVSESPSIKRQVRPALVSAVHKARTTRKQNFADFRSQQSPQKGRREALKPERLNIKPVSPTNSVSTQSTVSLVQRSHEVKETVKRARQARIERESSRRKDKPMSTGESHETSPHSPEKLLDAAFDFFAQSGRILDNFVSQNVESERHLSEAALPESSAEPIAVKEEHHDNMSRHKLDHRNALSSEADDSDSSDDSSEVSEFVEQTHAAESESMQSDVEIALVEEPNNEGNSLSVTISKSRSKSSTSTKESDAPSTRSSSLKEGSSGLTFTETSSAIEKHDSNKIVPPQDNISSSESSSSRPEALRWWQKNYGKKATGATNNAVRNALSKISPSNYRRNENKFKRIDADDDDIFDGLEEDILQKDARVEHLEFDERDASSSDPDEIGIPAPFGSHYLEKPKDSRSPTRIRSLPPPPPPPVSAHLRARDTNASPGGAETALFSDDSSKSVTSDVTMSLLTGKSRSSRFRSNAVETIIEGSHEDDRMALDQSVVTDENKMSHYSVDVEEDDDTVDRINVEESAPSKEESARGAKSPNSNVFLNLGCGFVDSISNACAPPSQLPVNAECVAQTKRDCEEKAKAFFHDRAGTTDEYSTTFMDDGTKTSFGRSYDASTFFTHRGEATTVTNSYLQLNDEERQIWHAWDNRDETSLEKILTEKRTQPSDSSGSGGEQLQKKLRHEAARTEAQRKLIEHADAAMANQGIQKENTAEVRTVPAPIEVSERNVGDVILRSPGGVDVALNFNQLSLLEKFSKNLKNGDVEVLKLGRRNKWQPRFLSVSEEVTWLRRDDSEGAVGQCPKALLWQKQPGAKHHATSIRADGRGGFDFSNLKSVRLEDFCPAYDRIPRRFKSKFPVFAGVTVEYDFEGGERQLVLCFQGKGEASAFNTAIGIIKLVVDREKQLLQQQNEAARRGIV